MVTIYVQGTGSTPIDELIDTTAPWRGWYSYLVALPFAGLGYLLWLLTQWVISHWFEPHWVVSELIALIGTLLLAQKLNSTSSVADGRYAEDSNAIGAVTESFDTLASYYAGHHDLSARLQQLACEVYCRWERLSHTVVNPSGRPTKKPYTVLLTHLRHETRRARLGSLKQHTLYAIRDLSQALRGIDRRQGNPIHFSTFVVIAIFTAITVVGLVAKSLTGHEPWIISLAAAMVIAYGIAVIVVLILHKQVAIGYHPGDYQAPVCFQAWLASFEDAREAFADPPTPLVPLE